MPFASKAQRDRLRRIHVRAKAKLGPRAPAPKAPGGKPTLKSSPLLRCLFKAKTELTDDDADVQEEPGPPAKLPRVTPPAAKLGSPAMCPEPGAHPRPKHWVAAAPLKARQGVAQPPRPCSAVAPPTAHTDVPQSPEPSAAGVPPGDQKEVAQKEGQPEDGQLWPAASAAVWPPARAASPLAVRVEAAKVQEQLRAPWHAQGQEQLCAT